MAQEPEVVIVDTQGTEHHFPPGFDPKRAAAIVAQGSPQQPTPPAPKGKSWSDVALDFIPTVGGAIGGLAGAVVGSPVTGAAMGGAAGQGIETALRHAGEIPGAVSDVYHNLTSGNADVRNATLMGGVKGAATGAKDAAVEAGIQGGSQQVGQLVAPMAQWASAKLMQSAVKPSLKMLEKTVGTSQMPRVIKTLLNEGITVTPSGAAKVNSLLNATGKEIDSIIANSTATMDPVDVIKPAQDVLRRVANQAAPSADMGAVTKVIKDFTAAHGDKVLTMSEAQALKQGTYQALKSRAYGETKGAAVEAEKAIARGLKEGIEQAHPEVGPLNARYGALVEARQAIAKRVAMASNRDPAGLAWLTANPGEFLAFALSRSPAAKSMLAHGLYKSAERATGIPENLLRFGFQALASARDEESSK